MAKLESGRPKGKIVSALMNLHRKQVPSAST